MHRRGRCRVAAGVKEVAELIRAVLAERLGHYWTQPCRCRPRVVTAGAAATATAVAPPDSASTASPVIAGATPDASVVTAANRRGAEERASERSSWVRARSAFT